MLFPVTHPWAFVLCLVGKFEDSLEKVLFAVVHYNAPGE